MDTATARCPEGLPLLQADGLEREAKEEGGMISRIAFEPEIREENGFYMAICRELKVAAPGDSADEAVTRLMSTLRTLFASLRRKGLLARALEEAAIPYSSITVPTAQVEMDVEMV